MAAMWAFTRLASGEQRQQPDRKEADDQNELPHRELATTGSLAALRAIRGTRLDDFVAVDQNDAQHRERYHPQ